MDLNHAFSSLEDWREFVGDHPDRLAADRIDAMGRRIRTRGFIEPLTRRRVWSLRVRHDGCWRESLWGNGLNCRMRAVLALIEQAIPAAQRQTADVFATEAITPFAKAMRRSFPRFRGSEYAPDEASRRRIAPYEHQDLTALTLPSEAFDLVTTNEVLEHVSDIDAALSEIARVLKPGGWHVGTHPFLFFDQASQRRAKLVDGEVVHLMPPEHHANPVDPGAGALVFETPGWDILERARTAGLHAAMRLYASAHHGVIGDAGGVFVLCAQKMV